MSGAPQRRTARAMRLTPGARLETTEHDRACRHPECGTTLSRYNPAPVCAAHGGWLDDESDRKRRRG